MIMKRLCRLKLKMNNVPVQQLNEKWHFQHSVQKIEGYDIGSMQYKISKSELEFEISKYNIVMVHVISKNFGLLILIYNHMKFFLL